MTHNQRVKKELSEAGITGYALIRAEGRALPAFIHEDEHIMAAVYGRTKDGAAMLVATDRRLIFFDKKPLITISDEISYEVVSGVGIGQENGLRSSITLYTRMGNYSVRMASSKSVTKFERYLEKTRLEGTPKPDSRRTTPIQTRQTRTTTGTKIKISKKASEFIANHEVGVLSTLDRTNQVHGAAVYYRYHEESQTLNILTKSETRKSHNILATHLVAFTIFDESTLQTAQIQGIAQIETDEATKQETFIAINRKRNYAGGEHHPPVSKLVDGNFIVFTVKITSLRFNDFNYRR